MNTNNNDSTDKPSQQDNPSDWQKTIDEGRKEKQKFPTGETSSPGQLNASGLPIPEALINRTLGSGTIVGYIGSGGMGDVYKIWNEHINRYHAVKLIKHGSNQQLEKRFEREIKITATFDHANIVHVHGAGRWKGYLFLEMEYVEGNGLDALLQHHGIFPPIVCVAAGILVARALNYAHNHKYTLDGKSFTGVIHRDLKPSNIMLSNDGRLKLMDFGIARPVGENLATLTMGIVGSWAYLPPEQLDGCSVDHRADIYTLGEVLYELLTGKAPFRFDNQREFLNCKSRGKYEPVAVKEGEIPGSFTQIIDKCLKVNPDSRFQSAHELEQELLQCYNKLTSLPPESVLTAFVKGEKIEGSSAASAQNDKRPVPAVAVAAALAVAGCIAFVALRMNFASRQPVKNDTPIAVSDTVTPVTKDIRPVAAPEIADSGGKDTLAPLPPGVPELLGPPNGKSNSTTGIAFRWKKVPDAEYYGIQIAADKSFKNPIFDSSRCRETAVTFKFPDSNSTWYWRVRAKSGSSEGDWSSVFNFTIQDTSANESKTDKDYGIDAAAALRNLRLPDAEWAIAKMSANDARKDTLIIRLAEKYLNSGNIKKADHHLSSNALRDKMADVLRGRILLAKQNCTGALKMLDAATRSKTRFDEGQVSDDVCYFRAVAARCCYDANKNDSTRLVAIQAWKEVWKMHRNNPSNPRFIEAANESRRIAD